MFPKKLSKSKSRKPGHFCAKLFLVIACMMLSFILGMLLSELKSIDFAGIKRVVQTKVLPKFSKQFEVQKEKKQQANSDEKLATMQKVFQGMPWMKKLKKAQEEFKKKGLFAQAKDAIDSSLRKKTFAQKISEGISKSIKKYHDEMTPAQKAGNAVGAAIGKYLQEQKARQQKAEKGSGSNFLFKCQKV